MGLQKQPQLLYMPLLICQESMSHLQAVVWSVVHYNKSMSFTVSTLRIKAIYSVDKAWNNAVFSNKLYLLQFTVNLASQNAWPWYIYIFAMFHLIKCQLQGYSLLKYGMNTTNCLVDNTQSVSTGKLKSHYCADYIITPFSPSDLVAMGYIWQTRVFALTIDIGYMHTTYSIVPLSLLLVHIISHPTQLNGFACKWWWFNRVISG